MRIATIYDSVQGEGALTGVPMTIVRLQGCHVRCPWCDTKETWDPEGGEEMTVFEISDRVRQTWVMITGGEPLEQDIIPLVTLLHSEGHQILLETSGTVDRPAVFRLVDWTCVSPKRGAELQANLFGADEVKFVIASEDDIVWADGLVRGLQLNRTITLQPVSQNPDMTRLCVKEALDRGWRLSIQIHKYIDVP